MILLAILLQCLLAPSLASPWLVSQDIEIVTSTVASGFTGEIVTLTPLVETNTYTVSPTVTPPSALTTRTVVESGVTRVDNILAPTQGVPMTSYRHYDYYVTVVYTVPESCSPTGDGTVTTPVPLYVPYEAANLLLPTAISTSTRTYSLISDESTQTMALVNPTDVPSSVMASVSSEFDDRYCRYASPTASTYSGGDSHHGSHGHGYCEKFTWYIGGSAFSGGYCCSDGCYYTWGIPPWGLALAIVFSWFGLFLILGIVESWIIFMKAMTGRKTHRGAPRFWVCLCPILSCLLLLYTRKQPAKSDAERAELSRRWLDMPMRQKLGLWLKWGFRRSDPTLDPAISGHAAYNGPVYPSPKAVDA